MPQVNNGPVDLTRKILGEKKYFVFPHCGHSNHAQKFPSRNSKRIYHQIGHDLTKNFEPIIHQIKCVFHQRKCVCNYEIRQFCSHFLGINCQLGIWHQFRWDLWPIGQNLRCTVKKHTISFIFSKDVSSSFICQFTVEMALVSVLNQRSKNGLHLDINSPPRWPLFGCQIDIKIVLIWASIRHRNGLPLT